MPERGDRDEDGHFSLKRNGFRGTIVSDKPKSTLKPLVKKKGAEHEVFLFIFFFVSFTRGVF